MQQFNSEPCLAVANGRLYLAIRNWDDRMMIRSLSGHSWSKWTEIGFNGKTPSGLAMVSLDRELWVIHRGKDRRLYASVFDGVKWTEWKEIPGDGQTETQPIAVVRGRDIIVGIRGRDSKIYINTREEGRHPGGPNPPPPSRR